MGLDSVLSDDAWLLTLLVGLVACMGFMMYYWWRTSRVPLPTSETFRSDDPRAPLLLAPAKTPEERGWSRRVGAAIADPSAIARRIEGVPSASDCAEACEATGGCVASTHSARDATCALATAVSSPVASPDHVTILRGDVPAFQSFAATAFRTSEPLVAYPQGASSADAPTGAACAALCAATDGCRAATFDPARGGFLAGADVGACALMRSVSGSVAPAPTATSFLHVS